MQTFECNPSTPDSSISILRDTEHDANLEDEDRSVLYRWFRKHIFTPFPTEAQKVPQRSLFFYFLMLLFQEVLRHEAHISLQQLNDWFINARRRYLPKNGVKVWEKFPNLFFSELFFLQRRGRHAATDFANERLASESDFVDDLPYGNDDYAIRQLVSRYYKPGALRFQPF